MMCSIIRRKSTLTVRRCLRAVRLWDPGWVLACPADLRLDACEGEARKNEVVKKRFNELAELELSA